MIARRELLAAGAALALVRPGGALARAAAAPPIFLYDGRIEESRAHAASRARRIDTGRDVASLWYGGLREASAGLPIGGLTGYADMVVVQGIARDERRRLSARPAGAALWSWTLE